MNAAPSDEQGRIVTGVTVSQSTVVRQNRIKDSCESRLNRPSHERAVDMFQNLRRRAADICPRSQHPLHHGHQQRRGRPLGQFPNGTGTISVTTPSGGAVTGSYANGRITGTAVDSGGDPGTFIVSRQQ